jgi:hypothetical protein
MASGTLHLSEYYIPAPAPHIRGNDPSRDTIACPILEAGNPFAPPDDQKSMMLVPQPISMRHSAACRK